MRLFRFGAPGKEKPGIVDGSGVHRDLTSVVRDIDPEAIADGLVGRIGEANISALPEVPPNSRFGACVSKPGNFIAIGLNYRQHAVETNAPIPAEPIIFSKAPSCIIGPNDDVVLPPESRKSDWEAELGLVIGKQAYRVSEEEALSHILGYCVSNDVSEREYQLERGGQWIKGKSAPTFGPVGPYLVTAEEIGDPQKLDIWLELNGRRVQSSSTSDMIFTVAQIVSYVSRFMVLLPGDLIITGTPEGVGLGMKPQRFLKAGDKMRLGVGSLGVQEQSVVIAS